MRCFGDFFEKNIDVDVFDDDLQNAKHRANDASNDVNRPPLCPGGVKRSKWFLVQMVKGDGVHRSRGGKVILIKTHFIATL